MNIPTKQERAEWRKLAEETMLVSAVGEYTPKEFTTLLDAVDKLEEELEHIRDNAMTSTKEATI